MRDLVSVRLKDIVKRFGKYEALRGITLEIKDRDFFFILGPSGCGKTTLLRIIAGLYEPDEGEVYFDNNLVNKVPPHKRNIGMVFQNYALWPHMTVYDNIAYGLKARNYSKAEIDKKVKWSLKLVRLEGMEKKYPNQLSGGQQQRVALARALVIEPDVLLLDEPLSNLDAKLRANMRSELKFLQKDLGITTIYVTHDQAEALSMADNIAVMNIGVIEQVGSPREIYLKPRTKFVADFIGEINFLNGNIVDRDDNYVIIDTPIGKLKSLDTSVNSTDVVIGFRPERIKLTKSGDIKMKVKGIMFYGFFEEVILSYDDTEIKVIQKGEERWFDINDEVGVEIEPDDVIVLRD
ncbi:MAG: ABC transporter ATP-binding protein [Thermoproteales archaeon]|nr:ABC transporter ATP-binding protein [Thermoproteales archaeon]